MFVIHFGLQAEESVVKAVFKVRGNFDIILGPCLPHSYLLAALHPPHARFHLVPRLVLC